MSKVWWWLLLTLFPALVFADSAFTPPSGSMSFTPPPGDYSVIFLGNIFGVVDGVLHGTGSQIMGVMLGVFNSAVLALGGIVIMYIILVSTLNTAHEGEMLGHKWSSIWVPIRTIIGLSLLIPKASGYCLMQIFVMWVTVQGVGVADKVWGAALDYLNRGGVIIKANMDPNISLTGGGNTIANGAATILYGQVCMLGIQTQLENARSTYLDQADSGTGPCAGTPSTKMQSFCDTSIPDFIATVDPITAQTDAENAGSSPSSYDILMPNFSSDSIFASLNGICGKLHWNSVNTDQFMTTTNVIDPATGECVKDASTGKCKTEATDTPKLSSLSQEDIDTIKMTRGLAVGQMYSTLATVARHMISNDPQITIDSDNDTSNDASEVAKDQFGVPLISTSTVCTGNSDDCPDWGADPSAAVSTSVLLDGTELQGAIADYNAVMAPTLKLISDSNNVDDSNSARAFIESSKETGWILAGSYFFDLVRLNGSAKPSSQTDSGSGLDNSTFDINNITAPFAQSGSCVDPFQDFCTFLNKISTKAYQVTYLIDGSGQEIVDKPSFSATSTFKVYQGTRASTVYGYVSNALNLDLPDQPGLAGPKIKLNFNLGKFDTSYSLPKQSFGGCMVKVKLLGCILPKSILGFFYNDLIRVVMNMIIDVFMNAVSLFLTSVLTVPILGFTWIFAEGVKLISTPGINPIVALAKMGITYINFAMMIWLAIGIASVTVAAIPYIGTALYGLLMLFMPLFIAWLGVMLGIAFFTAYYIPFLPYMLFTMGAIAWLMTVIEAMVAAPVVALGVAHPEGHDALGKSEQGLMILMNVFLRPVMMIIGYIAAISLSYVGIWVMNAGFQHVLDYMQGTEGWGSSDIPWAKVFGYFFASLLYTTMYLTIVQKAFSLIALLPDKVLRWIGGQAEQTGQETMQWMEEGKGQLKEAGTKTGDAGGQVMKQTAGHLGSGVAAARKGVGSMASGAMGAIKGGDKTEGDKKP